MSDNTQRSILVAGANGYIGLRLTIQLINLGYKVYALSRSSKRLDLPKEMKKKISFITGDLLDLDSFNLVEQEIDHAFYLVHSMNDSFENFETMERKCAKNFLHICRAFKVKQLVYLGGISPKENSSRHLSSRLAVEEIFKSSGINYTIFRAGIIIGSGSASFEIIRDLVEKLPVMVTPKWLNQLTQPISIRDVLYYLTHCIAEEKCLNQSFEIGGNEQLTYKELLLKYAKVRGLTRYIFTLPVLTIKLSSYWLYFITSTNYSLARSLVNSLKSSVICTDYKIREVIPHQTAPIKESFEIALKRVEDKEVVSGWKDAWVLSHFSYKKLGDLITVPSKGCINNFQKTQLKNSVYKASTNFFNIGGEVGWYYWNWAWSLRGFIDQCLGGVGLRRGRTVKRHLLPGDALDFWRVLVADYEKKRLLLYAEMKLPGEAWLEFRIEDNFLIQTATFRPKGLLGRLYWYFLYPFHLFIFRGMAKKIATL